MTEENIDGLDFELHYSRLHDEWQVWTPDYSEGTGAILGTGKTQDEAIQDAAITCRKFADDMIRRRVGLIKTEAPK